MEVPGNLPAEKGQPVRYEIPFEAAHKERPTAEHCSAYQQKHRNIQDDDKYRYPLVSTHVTFMRLT